jgi:regulator of CtrA degradation
MRLTTRLMQLASWLLIRRALSEGELTPEQAAEEQRKIKLPVKGSDERTREFDALPRKLKDLIEQSLKLQDRVLRLDQVLATADGAKRADSPLRSQLRRLHAAFGQEAD